MSHSLHSKIITAVLLLTTFSSTINAQETGPKNRNIELALQTGFGDFYSVGLSDETWNNYTPGFVVPDDSSQQNGYQMYSGTLFSVTSYVLGSVHVSYRNAMLDAKKIRSSFGLTFGSGVGYRTEQSWTKSETFTIDTLTSSQTGQQYAVDSTHQRTVGRSYEANDFMIGLSHFFQTNPARRCHRPLALVFFNRSRRTSSIGSKTFSGRTNRTFFMKFVRSPTCRCLH